MHSLQGFPLRFDLGSRGRNVLGKQPEHELQPERMCDLSQELFVHPFNPTLFGRNVPGDLFQILTHRNAFGHCCHKRSGKQMTRLRIAIANPNRIRIAHPSNILVVGAEARIRADVMQRPAFAL